MPEYLNQLLADSATALVNESFTGVSAPWWWERRIGGGIEVCQELDPGSMGREILSRRNWASKTTSPWSLPSR